jgi:hypothetical protein
MKNKVFFIKLIFFIILISTTFSQPSKNKDLGRLNNQFMKKKQLCS